MKRALALILFATLVGAPQAFPGLVSPAQATAPLEPPISLARFEGRWIDLSRGWQGARQCLVYPGRATECFRSAEALSRRVSGLGTPDISCSSPLVLHDGTYQTGPLVAVYARGLWIDMSTVGFNNMTSSYKVGACSVELANGAGGGGSHYSRCLYAGCVENVMAAGWNDAVSSVYLH